MSDQQAKRRKQKSASQQRSRDRAKVDEQLRAALAANAILVDKLAKPCAGIEPLIVLSTDCYPRTAELLQEVTTTYFNSKLVTYEDLQPAGTQKQHNSRFVLAPTKRAPFKYGQDGFPELQAYWEFMARAHADVRQNSRTSSYDKQVIAMCTGDFILDTACVERQAWHRDDDNGRGTSWSSLTALQPDCIGFVMDAAGHTLILQLLAGQTVIWPSTVMHFGCKTDDLDPCFRVAGQRVARWRLFMYWDEQPALPRMSNGAGDVVLDSDAGLQGGYLVNLEHVSSLRAACLLMDSPLLKTAPVWKMKSQLSPKELDVHGIWDGYRLITPK